jgi:hypothetical protein
MAPEIFALHSMNDILLDGFGSQRDSLIDDERDPNHEKGVTGFSWLQERLVYNYSTAWATPLPNGDIDTAVHVSGTSRWNNFYVEAVYRLAKDKPHIDGLYLDGIAFGRGVMQRLRRALDAACETRGKRCDIDFHSGNTNASPMRKVSPALVILQHMPYFDGLWFGEGFWWDRDPDYVFVEASGLAFGLTAESLGAPLEVSMVYGMSPRIKDDVTRKQAQMLWRLWDAFGIEHSQMLGYWNSECPVQIKKPHKNLRATAYVREDIGVSLVVVGNFGHAKSHKSVEVLFAKQHSAYATIVFGDRLEMSAPKYGNVRMDLKGKGGMLFASTMGSYPLVRLQKRISDDIY